MIWKRHLTASQMTTSYLKYVIKNKIGWIRQGKKAYIQAEKELTKRLNQE